jgi:hypothetical protein
MAEYADPVIDWLDQDDSMVSQRYFRQVSRTRLYDDDDAENTLFLYVIYI